jgi:hypothetical protein|tara:strand:+ start:4941 stop:5105 length:165 start_codon:yes stop_codon:yes gene_type:complete
MNVTLQPIIGCQVGIEFYEQLVTLPTKEEIKVGYVLIDLFFLRIQIAYYLEELE